MLHKWVVAVIWHASTQILLSRHLYHFLGYKLAQQIQKLWVKAIFIF